MHGTFSIGKTSKVEGNYCGRSSLLHYHRSRPSPAKSVPVCSSSAMSGAFIEKFEVAGDPNGPLNGLKFAAKDLFDIAGHPTGFGNPSWKATHPIPDRTSPCIQALLDNGATLVGKTHMDELAYSLNGENVHYGTPLNPLAPDRVPGGSSSGSASAVACGEVDFSVGSDTAGSVRVPASFCGILGIRATHGAVSVEHTRPLSPRFDTVGWFASKPGVFKDVGAVFLGHDASSTTGKAPLQKLLVCTDAFDLVSEDSRATLLAAVDFVVPEFASIDHINLSENISGGSLSAWFATFRTLQAHQVWEAHGGWIEDVQPKLGSDIADRFESASALTDAQVARAEEECLKIQDHLQGILGKNIVLCVPSAPGPAPLINSAEETINNFRLRAMSLTCVAGLGGLPQVSLPLGQVSGVPVGIGLIGPKHSDLQLLGIAYEIMQRRETDTLENPIL